MIMCVSVPLTLQPIAVTFIALFCDCWRLTESRPLVDMKKLRQLKPDESTHCCEEYVLGLKNPLV